MKRENGKAKLFFSEKCLAAWRGKVKFIYLLFFFFVNVNVNIKLIEENGKTVKAKLRRIQASFLGHDLGHLRHCKLQLYTRLNHDQLSNSESRACPKEVIFSSQAVEGINRHIWKQARLDPMIFLRKGRGVLRQGLAISSTYTTDLSRCAVFVHQKKLKRT
jgi:hypothetical protein